MNKYRVIRLLLLFLASIVFLGPIWELSKTERFKKLHIEKFILLFNLLLWDLTNLIFILDT